MVRIGIRVTMRVSVWLVSCYAHVFVLLSVVIVTLQEKPCELSLRRPVVAAGEIKLGSLQA